MNMNGINHPRIIAVSVAVLRHEDEFLLATRHAHQHQGDKLEFVGGKIEQGETPITALIREVAEELGLDVSDNQMRELGQIGHDYHDRQVRLTVYEVMLWREQYDAFKDVKFGLDNQRLLWLNKSALLKCADKMPDANRQILAWL